MAKKPKPQEGFQPYVVSNPASALGGSKFARLLIARATFCGVWAVARHPQMEPQPGVTARVIPEWQLSSYPKLPDTGETSLQSVISELKKDSLLHGATHEAVELLGELSPFDEKELRTMAEKLTRKGASKKAPAKEPKAKAPKAAKTPKADAAPAADKSYKHLVTPAKALESVREGTWTHRMVEIIMSHKSTAEAKAELAADKDYGDRRLDFNWASNKKGFISVPV